MGTFFQRGREKMNIEEVKAASGLARAMAFTEKEEKAANIILDAIEGMSVEEGVNILEKCIVFHALFGWHREYEVALKEYFGEGNPKAITK